MMKTKAYSKENIERTIDICRWNSFQEGRRRCLEEVRHIIQNSNINSTTKIKMIAELSKLDNHSSQTPPLHSTGENIKARRVTEKTGASCIGESRFADANSLSGKKLEGKYPLQSDKKEVRGKEKLEGELE